LPEVCHDPKNDDFWEFEEDSGMLIAKPNAPEEFKKAIEEWRAGLERTKNKYGDDVVVFL